jgi:hypothetical protein
MVRRRRILCSFQSDGCLFIGCRDSHLSLSFSLQGTTRLCCFSFRD